jgi:ferredoxin
MFKIVKNTIDKLLQSRHGKTTLNNNKIFNFTEKVKFTFINPNENKTTEVEAEEGQNILEIAHKYDVDLEGACEASLACSTCHVILEEEIYNKLTPAVEEEEDLLDMAFGLTPTSRLGCQVKITKDFEGAKVTLPSATRNLYVDGSKPKKH